MNLQMIVNDIKTLPPDKQEEVANFIAFLKSRLSAGEDKTSRREAEKSDSFIGMWRDRDEMADSSAWVQNIRSRE